MTDKHKKAWKQFIETSSAVVKVLIYLIQDLAPVIGYDEEIGLLELLAKHRKEITTNDRVHLYLPLPLLW